MTELLFLSIFALIMASLLVLMFRNKIIVKLGFRNILRRKGYTVIIVLGLMIGTGVISSSFVIGDTMDNMIESEILDSMYLTDEIIVGRKPTGESDYFNESIFDQINNQIDKKYIDGITAQITDQVAVLNNNTNLSEPSIVFHGIDFENDDNFGGFYSKNGKKVTSLAENELMIAKNSAEDLNAKTGHHLFLFANNSFKKFTVTYILQEKERAGSGNGIFVTIETAQDLLKKENMINRILISNKGGVYEGMEYTDEVLDSFEDVDIEHELDFEIMQNKKDVLKTGKESMQGFSDMFIIFGTFSIVAGIILIVNIFVMLGEERKSEMGMARAIGMQRKHLKRMYLSEGTIYALIASLVGVFFGVAIAFVIIYALENILSSFGDFKILQYFTFTPGSMIIGFVSGFLLTIITIYFTSGRISKLNIVRAIRQIPEPKISRGSKKLLIIGLLSGLIGLILLLVSIFTEQISALITGISLLVIASGLISRRWIGDRIAFNLVAIILLILWVLPANWFPNYSSGIEMFIVSGLFLVFSALLLVMMNSEQIVKGLTYIIGRGKSMQAVIKTAVSYALKSKFRTGMTITIFALVIFTITTMSMIVGMMGTNIENQVEKASGGYEIMAFTNQHSPIKNIETELQEEGISEKIEKTTSILSGRVLLNKTTLRGQPAYYTLLGVDDNFIEENEFEFSKLLEGYNSQNAWKAIKENKNLIIIDGTVGNAGENQYGPSYAMIDLKLGDTIKLKDKNDQIVEKKIIGILDTTYIQGIFTYDTYAQEEFDIDKPTVFLFSVKEGVDVDNVAKEIESTFLKNGMQAIAVKTMVLEAISTMNQFFNLFNAFMALGLIIGIAGLGIITIRSVHERRQEIGMMRAIGFKKRMILSAFLIETSVISILGIIIGTLLGIFTGYIIWRDDFQELAFDFLINWQPIIFVAITAFIFTLLCIFPASRKAAKIPPAEALRYE